MRRMAVESRTWAHILQMALKLTTDVLMTIHIAKVDNIVHAVQTRRSRYYALQMMRFRKSCVLMVHKIRPKTLCNFQKR